MVMENVSAVIINEPWFIPFDILMMTSSLVSLLLSIFFLLIIIFDDTCHTVYMMLVGNTCLSGIIISSATLALSSFTFHNDFKQIYYQDKFCVFRAFVGYISCGLFCFSFLLQAFHRYMVVIHPTCLLFRSFRAHIGMISSTWLFCCLSVVRFLFDDEIIYNGENQICQIPLRLSFATVYTAFSIYIFPISMLMLLYFKLVQYVHQMHERITCTNNTLLRAQRQLQMVRRTVLLVTILLVFGVPYISLVYISFFTAPPTYHYRIAFIFLDLSLALVMIILLPFTDPLKKSVLTRLRSHSRATLLSHEPQIDN